MRKLLSVTLVSLISLCPALFAEDFEGKVAMKVTSKGKDTVMNFSIKGAKTRLDTDSGGVPASVIFDTVNHQMTILITQQHMYMTRPFAAAPEAAAKAGAPKMDDVKLEKSAITEKILGYLCTKYTATGKEGTTEMWLTDALGAFTGMGMGGAPGGKPSRSGAMGGASDDWLKALEGKPVFPLRVITNKDGKESFRMEATSVEKVTLPDSNFAPPSDYQDMSAMIPSGFPGMR